MKIAAVIINVILLVFFCFVLVTDGPSKETSYIIFTIWSLATLIISPIVILSVNTNKTIPASDFKKLDSKNNLFRIVAITCNIIFLGFVCWALVDQYPHPKEEGLFAFIILMVLTPVLNLAALIRIKERWHSEKSQKFLSQQL